MKTLQRIGKVLLALIVVIACFLLWYKYRVMYNEPEIHDAIQADSLSVQQLSPNVSVCGDSWLRHSKSGLWELYSSGKPYEMGVKEGKLTKGLIEYQEKAFIDRIYEMIPSKFYVNFMKYIVAWFNRDIDDYVPKEFKQEIFGISRSASYEFNFIGPAYQRILSYHAAHDIGHAMQNINLVACTAFSEWDDSNLIVGRNFDFYAGDDFAKNKIVAFCKPDSGNAFMMVTWGGMTGVVSGMNEKGLVITLNAAKSNMVFHAKTPVSLLARMILQYAGNIDEAYIIAKQHETFVSESFLIASAHDNKSVVIEKSPKNIGMYAPHSPLILTNHYQSTVFKNDPVNVENIQESASEYRYKRVAALLRENRSHDPGTYARILRDRKGLSNVDIGMGNEKAINQLIAHHSIIFEPKTLRVWISTNPYQLGAYSAYDLHTVFSDSIDFRNEINEAQLTIPADSFLYSNDYKSFVEYKKQTQAIQKYITDDDCETIMKPDLQKYIDLNQQFYYPYVIVGRCFMKQGNSHDAEAYFTQALQLEIPTIAEKMEIQELLTECKKH